MKILNCLRLFYEVEKYFDSLLKVFVVVTEYSLMNCLL